MSAAANTEAGPLLYKLHTMVGYPALRKEAFTMCDTCSMFNEAGPMGERMTHSSRCSRANDAPVAERCATTESGTWS